MHAEPTAGKTPEEAAPGWTRPETYAAAGYAPTVGALFGGMAGRIETLQKELKK